MPSTKKIRQTIIVAWLTTSLGGISVAYATSPAPVNLRTSARFAILSKSGISDVPASNIVGNIGTSPITGAADHLTCAEVAGRVLSVDAAGPSPCSVARPLLLKNAILDMQAAYKDAAGRAPDVTELGAGNIGGLTVPPGVYKWTTGVLIPTDVTLSGSSTGVWIFQIAGNLKISDAKAVILHGGARPRNIFWQVAGKVTIGTTARFHGTILSKTLIAMNTAASIRGRLLAQTGVTLQKSVVHKPD